MWQTNYASAVPKNLGVGVDFRPCSEGNFLTGRPQSLAMGNPWLNLRVNIKHPLFYLEFCFLFLYEFFYVFSFQTLLYLFFHLDFSIFLFRFILCYTSFLIQTFLHIFFRFRLLHIFSISTFLYLFNFDFSVCFQFRH